MDTVLNFFRKLNVICQALSTPQKIFYTGSLLVLAGCLSFLLYTVNKTEYAPLYSRLSEEDLGSVVATLKAKKIPYHLTSDGGIGVPSDSLYETRLALATEGVPKGGGVGFEVFDEQKLGSTEFVQKINYQRALQGELARTINELDEVAESRVHLVLPSESVFIEDQNPPTAAVVLKLQPGARLEQQQIQGIVNLVASAVQGMKEDKVTILSTDGQVFFRKNAVDTPLQMSNVQIQLKNRMEEDLRQKVQSLLEQVVGSNRAVVRVAADLNFNEVRVSEETYDPDSAVVRSQQRSIENSQGGEAGARGNPDAPLNVESQLMQPVSPPSGQQKVSNRQRETVNYEINHVSRQTTYAPGGIKKLSVAVIVDGPYEMKTDSQGNTASVFVGRTPAELKSLEEIVKKAVGYDEGRGDQITVSSTAFASDSEGSDFVKSENKWLKLLRENQKILLNLVLIVLAFFFVIKPFMRKFQQLGDKIGKLPDRAPALPGGVGEYPGLMEPRPEAEFSLRKHASALVRHNPDRATEIIRTMLREEN